MTSAIGTRHHPWRRTAAGIDPSACLQYQTRARSADRDGAMCTRNSSSRSSMTTLRRCSGRIQDSSRRGSAGGFMGVVWRGGA